MRCPSCEKFVSFDTEADPEENDEPTMEGRVFRAAYRRVLTCADCGEELKDANLEVEQEVATEDFKTVGNDGEERPATVDEIDQCGQSDDGEHDWDLDVTATPTTESQTKDRHGKTIKNPRYMRTLYGVQVEGTATCSECGLVAIIDVTDSVQASGMEELV